MFICSINDLFYYINYAIDLWVSHKKHECSPLRYVRNQNHARIVDLTGYVSFPIQIEKTALIDAEFLIKRIIVSK